MQDLRDKCEKCKVAVSAGRLTLFGSEFLCIGCLRKILGEWGEEAQGRFRIYHSLMPISDENLKVIYGNAWYDFCEYALGMLLCSTRDQSKEISRLRQVIVDMENKKRRENNKTNGDVR